MPATNINVVVLTGNLTRDPELRTTPSGMSVCNMRVAVNGRRKDNATGEWVDKPNYFDISVFGTHGENCAQYLAKGRPVAIDGRLDWHEWTDQNDNKRQAVNVIADSVQFLNSKDGNAEAATTPEPQPAEEPEAKPAASKSTARKRSTSKAKDKPKEQPVPAGAGASTGTDDDIPF